MPDFEDHRRIVDRNLAFVAACLGARECGGFTGKLASAYFHAAMHSIEAFFAREGEHNKSHQQRERAMRQSKRLRGLNVHVRAKYKVLQTASYDERYNGREPTAGDLLNELKPRFEEIDSAMRSLY